MVFELRKDDLGRWIMVCLDHGIAKTFEEASAQGLAGLWRDGRVVTPKVAEVLLFDARKVLPRQGKRPAIGTARVMSVRCNECGKFEEHEILNCSVLGKLVRKNG